VSSRLSLLLAAVLGASLLTVAGSAVALDTGRTGPLNNRGFPAYYVDDAGRALQLCDDGTPLCLGVGRNDLRPPDGEALYWAALSPVRSRRGTLEVEFALEAAFEGRRPVVFRRMRVRGHVNLRGRYVLEHPYGTTRFRAAPRSEQRNVNITRDIRCARDRGGVCAPLMTRWLRSTERVAGHLGSKRRTPVRGGAVRNALLLYGPNGDLIGRSERFRVIGKLCGPRCRRRAR
jgi:hypothetical protein